MDFKTLNILHSIPQVTRFKHASDISFIQWSATSFNIGTPQFCTHFFNVSAFVIYLFLFRSGKVMRNQKFTVATP